MTLKQYLGPADGNAVMQREVGRRLPRSDPLSMQFHANHQQAVRIRSRPPIPGYYLGLDAMQEAAPLTRAIQTVWLFPVMLAGEPALVNIRSVSERTESSYGGYSVGLLAQRVHAALSLAGDRFGNSDDEYQPRLLDVPSLQFSALWLAGTGDHFISLFDGRPLASAPLKIVDDILDTLRSKSLARSRADAFIRTFDDSSSPTN